MNVPPLSHKLLAAHLRERFGGKASVAVYRDNQGKRPIPIGSFVVGKHGFHSTIGMFESRLSIPEGTYELAVLGTQHWLPNSLASSVYWLRERTSNAWPLVCEDVIRQNARSRYRHLAYAPSAHAFEVTDGVFVQWLLGLPLADSEIGIPLLELQARLAEKYPDWLVARAA